VQFHKEAEGADTEDDVLADALGGSGGSASKGGSATITSGGKKRNIPFGKEGGSIREKLESLSPRQKSLPARLLGFRYRREGFDGGYRKFSLSLF
jgi:hypothetical protein